MIVPFAAGGPTDLLARIIGERMGKELGQQFIIENVTGAAGTIAMAKLARAAPDGYTIGIGHVCTDAATAEIYTKLGFDLVADLEPIARLPANPCWCSPNVPVKDAEVLVETEGHPDKVSGCTRASLGCIGRARLHQATAPPISRAYRGTGPPCKPDFGQIQVMVDQSSNPAAVRPQDPAYAQTRPALAPMADIPTAAEAGYREVRSERLWAPKGRPRTSSKAERRGVTALSFRRAQAHGGAGSTCRGRGMNPRLRRLQGELSRWKPISKRRSQAE